MENSNDIIEVLGINCEFAEEVNVDAIASQYAKDLWINEEKKQLNENTFAKWETTLNNFKYSNGLFYSNAGRVTQDIISQHVRQSLEMIGINTKVAKTTKDLVEVIKLVSTVEKLDADPNIIPFANGDLDIKKMVFYVGSLGALPYRLPVSLVADFTKKESTYFNKWLNDLLTVDDQKTFQEFLGYCLVPHTKAQKSLFLVGEGGAGKSILGVILDCLLGRAMISVSNSQEFLQDKFKLPELEHKLVLYDDDLDNKALEGTGIYKKLITNQQEIIADRKYGHPFPLTPYVKLVSCCNEMLQSTYDQTDGFYRRLLPLVIKPKRKDFAPDKDFADKIRNEKEYIVAWAVQGLIRLSNRNWEFTISKRTSDYLESKKAIANHFPDFMDSCFDFGKDFEITTDSLNRVYQRWCSANACDPRKARAVQQWLTDNAEIYNIVRSNNIDSADGKRVRGFKGLKINDSWVLDSSVIQF